MRRGLILLAAVIVLGATNAQATVTISNAPTRNMICSGGVCAPTARMAVLNVGDLESALASGSVEVSTTGSNVQAGDLDVFAPISWASASTLSLDSSRFLFVKRPISVAGSGGLSLKVNDGGSGGVLLFQRYGHATFADLASPLSIDGKSYTLVNSIASLASAVASNPAGDYALASSYNAQPDGIYTASPIPEEFDGIFEGLGNTIAHLKVRDRTNRSVGLFSHLGMTGAVNGLRMSGVVLLGGLGFDDGRIGGIIGDASLCAGSLVNDSVSGSIHGLNGMGGGLAGCAGYIAYSSSSANVFVKKAFMIGGLVGLAGKISNSFATGTVTIENTVSNYVGGLAGQGVADSSNNIQNSYATGAVTGGRYFTGGLEGWGSALASYSTGAVSGTGYVGGSLGAEEHAVPSINVYWDTTTSGTDTGVGQGDQTGVTGLTTEQLQAGLPAGFDPTIWGPGS